MLLLQSMQELFPLLFLIRYIAHTIPNMRERNKVISHSSRLSVLLFNLDKKYNLHAIAAEFN